MLIVVILAVSISISIAAMLGAFTKDHESESKIFVELRADMINSSDPSVMFEANATWWINTTSVQSASQKWGWALVGRSGPNVPFNASYIYLPIKKTDGYLYCVPQTDNIAINQSKTIAMNPRVDSVFESDVDWNGKVDDVLRCWCSPNSFPSFCSGYPVLYVTVWIGDLL
jgi:hypothetical protein